MHPLVTLAKNTVEQFIAHGRLIPAPEELTPEMKTKAGVFVSLKKHGQLRGCIGTFMPVTKNVAEEIIRNAVSAATEDPRFNPVEKRELPDLVYSVDVLSQPDKINDLKALDPKKYGIIVVKGNRRGLLLPALEGVDTVDEQLRITKMKAGIDMNEVVDIFRFEVRRYH